MSNQDPLDPSQLPVDNPGTLVNADHNDLEDHRPSDNTTEYLTPAEAMALMRQQMTAPSNLNQCCYQQEVDCNCHRQIQTPDIPPPKDLGYGRSSPEKRRTIEDITKSHQIAREAILHKEPSSTTTPLASPKPRSPTGHKDPEGNSRSVLLSDEPFENQFTYPMPEVLTNPTYGPTPVGSSDSNLVDREHADWPKGRERYSGLYTRVYDNPERLPSAPLSPSIMSPSRIKRANSTMDKTPKNPHANTTRTKRHKAKQSKIDETLSLPSSPIISNWSASIAGSPAPQPSPMPIDKPIDNEIISISSGESNSSDLDYTSDNTIKGNHPSPPPPNQLQMQPRQIETSLMNFSTPNPETYSTPNADHERTSQLSEGPIRTDPQQTGRT